MYAVRPESGEAVGYLGQCESIVTTTGFLSGRARCRIYTFLAHVDFNIECLCELLLFKTSLHLLTMITIKYTVRNVRYMKRTASNWLGIHTGTNPDEG